MKMTRTRRETVAGYLFIMPNFLGFLLFSLLPVLASVGISLTDWNISGDFQFIGLSNYKEMFVEDPKFYTIFWNTFYFTLLYVPLVLVISLGLALLVNRGFKTVIAFRFMYFLPVVTSAVARIYGVSMDLQRRIRAAELPDVNGWTAKGILADRFKYSYAQRCGGEHMEECRETDGHLSSWTSGNSKIFI